MKKTFDFNNLFTYDLANNHQGDVEHGLRIIKEIGKVNSSGIQRPAGC